MATRAEPGCFIDDSSSDMDRFIRLKATTKQAGIRISLPTAPGLAPIRTRFKRAAPVETAGRGGSLLERRLLGVVLRNL